MPNNYIHLSDQELIMAADGELSAPRKGEVLEHLEACWNCRERARALEATILEFARARNHALNDRVPSASGPGALLRARLAEASSLKVNRPRTMWRPAYAAAAFLSILAVVAVVFVTTVSAKGLKPKAEFTPGETRPITVAEICRDRRSEVISRNIPEETRRKVFSEYGINGHWDNFEVDYLITPDLGGARSIRNLWPQPYTGRWNAVAKDRLEQRLHDLVCEGKVDLTRAQRDIALDWIGAYKKYVGSNSRGL
jgi:hypothetical protein